MQDKHKMLKKAIKDQRNRRHDCGLPSATQQRCSLPQTNTWVNATSTKTLVYIDKVILNLHGKQRTSEGGKREACGLSAQGGQERGTLHRPHPQAQNSKAAFPAQSRQRPPRPSSRDRSQGSTVFNDSSRRPIRVA